MVVTTTHLGDRKKKTFDGAIDITPGPIRSLSNSLQAEGVRTRKNQATLNACAIDNSSNVGRTR